jgi:CBS domain-containing protein
MYASDILAAKGSEVVTVEQTVKVEKAAKLLREGRFGALVVVDAKGSVSGILSERDIIRVVADHGGSALALRVEDVMTRAVKTCKPDETIKEIMNTMNKNRFRHLPVVVDGKLAGLISQTDIIKHQLAEMTDEVRVMHNLSLMRK